MISELEIRNLHVSIQGKKILNGVNLKIKQGELHALMGPNGSGKSTLSYVLMGHSRYVVEQGEILLNGENITKFTPDKRAKLGLFLGFQYPTEVSGVTLKNFLWAAYKNLNNGSGVSFVDFNEMLDENLKSLSMDRSFITRYLNEGFSGGEKKRAEMLQLSVLRPTIAIMDEIDSGTDVDALKTIASNLKKIAKDTGILLITHYQKILSQIKPDFVHIMMNGKIVKNGDSSLAKEIEERGYGEMRNG